MWLIWERHLEDRKLKWSYFTHPRSIVLARNEFFGWLHEFSGKTLSVVITRGKHTLVSLNRISCFIYYGNLV